jgi:XRE family transcriptional regulator, regulator of sulfur utilization
MMSLTKKIGENIRKIREGKKISQHRLAKEAEVSLSLLNWIEVGKRDNVTIRTLEKVGKILEVSVEKLVQA